MSERIDVSRPRLELLVAAWPVGAVIDAERITLGIENTNYFVTTVIGDMEREWVLTLMAHPPTRSALEVLEAADAAGLPVPVPVRDGAGQATRSIPGGGHALLAPRLRGRHPERPTARQCAAAGRFLARLHEATAALSAPPHPRSADWMRLRAAVHRPRLGLRERELLAAAVGGLGTLQRREDWRRLPHGVVHGDLFRDNALFEEERLTGVIDFHHAAHAPLAFDLAVVAADWCRSEEGGLDRNRMLALLQAYHGERALTPLERCFWPALLVLAATRFWIARLDSPRKPPEELRELTDALLRQPPLLEAALAL
jgi:homoserine kinase type II